MVWTYQKRDSKNILVRISINKWQLAERIKGILTRKTRNFDWILNKIGLHTNTENFASFALDDVECFVQKDEFFFALTVVYERMKRFVIALRCALKNKINLRSASILALMGILVGTKLE